MAQSEQQQIARANAALKEKDKSKPLNGEDLFQLTQTAKFGRSGAKALAQKALSERGLSW